MDQDQKLIEIIKLIKSNVSLDKKYSTNKKTLKPSRHESDDEQYGSHYYDD